jgi:4-amino-4-deoxy-L-arabinose transferase-like glycosyltransferase
MQNFLAPKEFEAQEYRILKILIVISILLKISFLFNTVLNSDGALYSQVAFDMSKSKWYTLNAFGREWLDKPHLVFWVNALFFKLFNANVLIYKLCATIILLTSGYYTYLIAKLLYNKNVALLSVLIYFNFLEINTSLVAPKLEPYLLTFICASVYSWLQFVISNKYKYFIIGALFSALAVMTKGFFVLFIIFSPLGFIYFSSFFIDSNATNSALANFKSIRSYTFTKLLMAIVLILVFSSPDSIAFWLQFGNKGLRFFFWDSQFGRFNGALLANGASRGLFSYYSEHVTLMLVDLLLSALPFTFIFIYAVINYIKNFNKINQQNFIDLLVIIPFIAMLIIFGLSRFYNFYYAAITMPFMAIFSASFLYTQWENRLNKLNHAMVAIGGVFTVLLILTNFLILQQVVLVASIIGLIALGFLYNKFSNPNLRTLVFLSIAINLYMVFNVTTYFNFYKKHNIGYVIGTELAKLPQHRVFSNIPRDLSSISLFDNNIKDIGAFNLDTIDKDIPCYVIIANNDFDKIENQINKLGLHYTIITSFDDRDNPTVEYILVRNFRGPFEPYKINVILINN